MNNEMPARSLTETALRRDASRTSGTGPGAVGADKSRKERFDGFLQTFLGNESVQKSTRKSSQNSIRQDDPKPTQWLEGKKAISRLPRIEREAIYRAIAKATRNESAVPEGLDGVETGDEQMAPEAIWKAAEEAAIIIWSSLFPALEGDQPAGILTDATETGGSEAVLETPGTEAFADLAKALLGKHQLGETSPSGEDESQLESLQNPHPAGMHDQVEEKVALRTERDSALNSLVGLPLWDGMKSGLAHRDLAVTNASAQMNVAAVESTLTDLLESIPKEILDKALTAVAVEMDLPGIAALTGATEADVSQDLRVVGSALPTPDGLSEVLVDMLRVESVQSDSTLPAEDLLGKLAKEMVHAERGNDEAIGMTTHQNPVVDDGLAEVQPSTVNLEGSSLEPAKTERNKLPEDAIPSEETADDDSSAEASGGGNISKTVEMSDSKSGFVKESATRVPITNSEVSETEPVEASDIVVEQNNDGFGDFSDALETSLQGYADEGPKAQREQPGSVRPVEPVIGAGGQFATQTVVQPNAMAGQSLTDFKSSMQEQIDNVERIAEALKTTARQGVQRLTVQLSPPELGKVTLKMEFRRGEVSAVMQVEKPEAHRQLVGGLEELRRNLKVQGIELGSLEVRQEGRPAGDGTPGHHPKNFGSGRSESNGKTIRVNADVDAPEEEIRQVRNPDGVLNLIA